jgi:hypothetical protein
MLEREIETKCGRREMERMYGRRGSKSEKNK